MALVVELLELTLIEIECLLIEVLLLLLLLLLLLELVLVCRSLEEIVRLLRIEIALRGLPVRYRLAHEQRLSVHLSHGRALRKLNPILS